MITLGLLLIGAACGRANPSSAGPSLSGAAPPASPSASASTSAPAGTPPSRHSASDRCRTSAVRASFASPDAGAGQRYVLLKLTNTSATECSIFGYGGMQLVDAARHPLPTSLKRVSPPAPKRVHLAPGASAVSQLHWTAVPGMGEPTTGACEQTPSFALVTPPDETTTVQVAWTMGPVCQHGAIDQQPYH
ncbi:MAG: DUF4232 domain-containing protein [Pseudonocardiales bacterium]